MKQGFECNQYLNKEPCFSTFVQAPSYEWISASLVSTDFLYVHIYLSAGFSKTTV